MTTRVHDRIEHDLAGYLPKDYVIVGVYMREEHGWTAIAVEFDVAGDGETPQEAIDDANEGVLEYLALCQSEGISFEEANRPAPEDVRNMFRESLEAELSEYTRKRPGKSVQEAPKSYRGPLVVHC